MYSIKEVLPQIITMSRSSCTSLPSHILYFKLFLSINTLDRLFVHQVTDRCLAKIEVDNLPNQQREGERTLRLFSLQLQLADQ